MGDECRKRPWDSLMPDTLGLIFQKLSLQDILSVVPRVCKSWANVVRGPYCWHEISIEEWSSYCQPETLDRMLQMLLSRSSGSLRRLHVYGLSTNNTLSLIADNAKTLQDLRLHRSDISNSIVEEVSWKLSNVTLLDLSYCTKIGASALEALGKHCKLLTTLLRNMHPWDVMDRRSQDDEALAIATTMPNLRHLELAYLRISTEGVVQLIGNLCGLELLDVRGCWNVKLDNDLLDRLPKLRLVGPLVPESLDKSDGVSGVFSWNFRRGTSSHAEYIGSVDDILYDDDDDVWGIEQYGDDLDLLFYD